MDDVLKIFDRARQPIDARYHQSVTMSEKLEQQRQFRSSRARKLPLTFSDQMTSQPARRSASSWIVTFCSSVDARA
jgi:hypothetical protein